MTNITVFATAGELIQTCAKSINYQVKEWQNKLEQKQISPVIIDTKVEHNAFVGEVLGKDTVMHRFSLTVVWEEEKAK